MQEMHVTKLLAQESKTAESSYSFLWESPIISASVTITQSKAVIFPKLEFLWALETTLPQVWGESLRGFSLLKLPEQNSRNCSLNNLFLIVLEAGKSKVKVPAYSVPSKEPLPALWIIIFYVLTWPSFNVCWRRERDLSPSSSSLSLLLLFSYSVMSDSLWPHGLQHTRLPCPLLSPNVCSNSCPLSQWCSNHLNLCCLLLLLPSVFPSIRVFSNESVSSSYKATNPMGLGPHPYLI